MEFDPTDAATDYGDDSAIDAGESAQAFALLVVNKASRLGGDADLEPFVEVLKAAGIRTEIATLSRSSTLEKLLRDRRRPPDIILVAGGDGTVHGSAGALLQSRRPFGLVPLGTANDLARSLGIPTNIADAADVITRGQTCRIDVGMANDQYFFNVAGIGLGPEMTKDLEAEAKSRWGVLSYLVALFRTLRKKDSFKVTITCNGERLRVRALQLNIANGKFYGGGMTASEDTCLNDGKLDLIVVKAVSIPGLLRLGPKLRWGKVAREPDFIVRRAERIHVATRKPMVVSTDGELTTETPVQFTVLHRKVRAFISPAANGIVSEITDGDVTATGD